METPEADFTGYQPGSRLLAVLRLIHNKARELAGPEPARVGYDCMIVAINRIVEEGWATRQEVDLARAFADAVRKLADLADVTLSYQKAKEAPRG